MRNPNESALRRWSRRIGIGLGLLPVLMVGAWGYLQWDSSRKLQAVIDAAHARGEPILPADLKAKALPADQNAAPLLRAAARPLERLTKRESDVLLPSGGSANGKWEGGADGTVASVLLAHPDVLRLIAEARGKAGVAWPMTLATPMIDTDMTYLKEVRLLTAFATNVAVYRHRQGEDGAAISRLRDAVFAGRSADGTPMLVPHLVAVGCDALVSNAAMKIAMTLKVGKGTGAAAPGQVAALIADLTDDASRQADLKRSLLGEKVSVIDGIMSVASQTKASSFIAFFVRYNAVHAAEGIDAVLAAAQKPNWPAASAVLKPWIVTGKSKPFHMLGDILMPSVAKGIKSDFKAAAARRVAATMLAIRLYQADHDGKRPGALADLVPAYLPALPADPFATDGRTFGYAPSGPDARLWSVGMNGTDDGGAFPKGRPLTREEGGPPWDFADAVFPLDAHAPWSDPPPITRPG